jgi:YhcH/YjgK/YiaL family protein
MAIFGSLATVQAQTTTTDKFASCFAYLDDLFRADSASAKRMRAIARGETQRIELAGGAFALEQVYVSKLRANGFFESHRTYIDVQVVLEGEEWMEVTDLHRCTVRDPYDSTRDLLIYADATGSRLRMTAGDAAVFFPVDVHMPGLCGDTGPGLVRKSVIKIPVDAR